MKAKNLVIGILAHVDAGKTTLSEGILYCSGSIRKPGRVDHKDAFLDTDRLERARGITIFSRPAQIRLGDKDATLLDTPGHADFSAEMERALQVLDYAVLVINGADGVQSHTMTLWHLLQEYRIPVFLFINKMDQVGADREQLLNELQKRLDEQCLNFGTDSGLLMDALAMCAEPLMEEYLKTGTIEQIGISRAIAERTVFPCYFGSALKLEGVEELLAGIGRYSIYPAYPQEFAARVYKITRDSQGNRLSHMKITGGSLKVKASLTGREKEGQEPAWQEKVNQIRIYSGEQYQAVNEASVGSVCAVLGLSKTRAGEGLGAECFIHTPLLGPVLTYRIQPPCGCDMHSMLQNLRQLEEEEPQLHIIWDEQMKEIRAQLMGELEIEILKSRIAERFAVEVEFESGSIVYKETIREPAVGVGHFEPLGHYAEVHLLLEPLSCGSGLQFDSRCSEDLLDRNWQRLILSHLEEKTHRGVLIGAEITDLRITLIAGKAHQKHTVGGDFRQATYRAVRQGLRRAESVLLEPVYQFRLEVPTEMAGRALADLQRMHGTFEAPQAEDAMSIITGRAPVAKMRGYQRDIRSYTKGRGKLFTALKGYEPCRVWEAIAEEKAYDPDKDPENPCGSVFCSHGAGFTVCWDEAEQYMHVDSGYRAKALQEEALRPGAADRDSASGYADEKELKEIFLRTYGLTKRERNPLYQCRTPLRKEKPEFGSHCRTIKEAEEKEQYLLVDGYNILFAWEELKELAKVSLEGARGLLLDILSNYQGYAAETVIVVFDAYKVEGGQGAVYKENNLHVIYTKEAETADQYIEKAVRKIGKTHDVTVATSDNLVQMIIWADGAKRLSALGLKEKIDAADAHLRETYLKKQEASRNYALENLKDVIKTKEV